MPMEDLSKAKREIASGTESNETNMAKISETAYFYLSQQINDLRDRTDSKSELLRAELKQEINSVKTELNQKMDSVRNELKQEIDSVRNELKQEIDSVKSELDKKIESVRYELKQEILTLNNKFEQLYSEVNQIRESAHQTNVMIIVTLIAVILSPLIIPSIQRWIGLLK
ncbi:MAG: apolipoprotein A1/A4/E family protein [Tepidanaerobacteraceae bacterium]|nr:apolipoprotein A1/A4/E family protein [Tepidanaerobacteraceae bacterium]